MTPEAGSGGAGRRGAGRRGAGSGGAGSDADRVTVGLDIGTSSVKAIAATGDGTVLARARVPHPIRSTAAGDFEHDVDRAWRIGVIEALGAVASNLDVAAVAVAAMVPSLGAVDADGHALGPGLLYGDHRGHHEGHDPTFPGNGGELLAFLGWQVRNHPDAFAYWPAQGVANHALCGVGAVDANVAMSAWPLFDLENWDRSLAESVGTTTDKLPVVVKGFEPAGRISAGLPAAGALVGGGTIDALGEQLVAGAVNDGDVHVLCGTTLITWAVTSRRLAAPGLWTVPHHVARHELTGGPSNAGGLFLDMVNRWVGPSAIGGLAEVEPDDLPVWLPYVRGERTPLHRPDLRAGVFDVTHRHGPSHLLAAAYEATAFVVRHHLDLAREAGHRPTRIVATGGGSRCDGLMQALADVNDLPVDVAASPEGAALGAAFIARCVAGLEEHPGDADRWAGTDRRVEPRPLWHDAAQRRYGRFRSLTEAAVADAPAT